MNPDPISAVTDQELDAAISAVKGQLGMETARGDVIASMLPEHLRQPFWSRAVDRYLDAKFAELGMERPTADEC